MSREGAITPPRSCHRHCRVSGTGGNVKIAMISTMAALSAKHVRRAARGMVRSARKPPPTRRRR